MDYADSAAAFGAVESSMTHISGFERSQILLLPEAVDDYVGVEMRLVVGPKVLGPRGSDSGSKHLEPLRQGLTRPS